MTRRSAQPESDVSVHVTRPPTTATVVDTSPSQSQSVYCTDVIYILLDTVLATDVNKYSLASASCQPIWRTLVGELDLF